MDDREGFKQFALQLGQELSDSDLADWDGEPGGEAGAATPADGPDGRAEGPADDEPGAAREAAAGDADDGLGPEPDDELDDEPDDEPGQERA
jgi:hypothetical protein